MLAHVGHYTANRFSSICPLGGGKKTPSLEGGCSALSLVKWPPKAQHNIVLHKKYFSPFKSQVNFSCLCWTRVLLPACAAGPCSSATLSLPSPKLPSLLALAAPTLTLHPGEGLYKGTWAMQEHGALSGITDTNISLVFHSADSKTPCFPCGVALPAWAADWSPAPPRELWAATLVCTMVSYDHSSTDPQVQPRASPLGPVQLAFHYVTPYHFYGSIVLLNHHPPNTDYIWLRKKQTNKHRNL